MRRNAAITLRSIALNEIELGLFREAVAHLLEALATFTELGLTLNAVMARNCLGEACLRTGDLDGAQEWLLSAADGAEQPSSRYERARAMRSLGEIALARGDRDAAIARWQEALDIYEAVGAPEAAEVSGRMALAS
jgi:tetratricopeptide (TPR) repeat protein